MKAIIFDLDGTIYRQTPLRRAMMGRLLRAHLLNPLGGLRTLRVLAAYRQAQEILREASNLEPPVDLSSAQVSLTCERTGASSELVMQTVDRWMDREPLAYLRRYVQPGLVECLRAAAQYGIKLGVLSDYPAEAKLRALGVANFFDVVQSAQSSAIGAFKPHPRGLEVTMQLLQVEPSACLYVGDRADVDAPAAAAAGVSCFILERDGDFGTLQRLLQSPAVAQPLLHSA